MNANWVTQLSRKCLRKLRAFIQGALARKSTQSGKIQITARRRAWWWTVRFSRQYPARGRPSLLWVHSPTSRGSLASPVLNLLTGVITVSRGCLRQGELEGGKNSALILSLQFCAQASLFLILLGPRICWGSATLRWRSWTCPATTWTPCPGASTIWSGWSDSTSLTTDWYGSLLS